MHFGIWAGSPIGRVKNALVVLLSFDNNALDVQFFTGERIVLYRNKKMTGRIEIPDNLLLMHKKYSLSSSYDISDSYSYYISEISNNYIFIGNYTYKLSSANNNYYVQDARSVKSIRTRGFNVNILNDRCIAKLEKASLEPKSDFGVVTVYRTVEEPAHEEDEYLERLGILDLNKVHQLYKNNKIGQSSYVDVSDYVYEIIIQRIIDEAVRMIKDRYYTDYRFRYSMGYYSLSMSEHSATLYITVTIEAWRSVEDRKEDRILIIYDVRRLDRNPCKVIFMSSHENIIKLYDKSELRSKALRILTDYEYSKMNFLMLSAHALYNLHPAASPYLVEYCGDLIIYNDCKNLKVVDIKFNRTSKFQFEINLVGNIYETNHYIRDDIVVEYNFTSKEDIKTYYYYSVIVMSELLLTKSIEILTREEYLNLGIL